MSKYPTYPTFEDVMGCQAILFEWAESYDSKDWERLSRCIAPTLRVDYSSFLNKFWEAMPANEFITMASDPKVIGNPLLKTQHFVGGTRWEKTADDEITGYHQLRVAHQKYTDQSCKTVAVKGHAHGRGTMWYKKVGDVWKWAGVSPHVRWTEYDYDQVFAEGRDSFGEDAPVYT